MFSSCALIHGKQETVFKVDSNKVIGYTIKRDAFETVPLG